LHGERFRFGREAGGGAAAQVWTLIRDGALIWLNLGCPGERTGARAEVTLRQG
jgi:hypothetical protein